MKKLKRIVTVLMVAVFILISYNAKAQNFDKIGIEHNKILNKILPKIKNANAKNIINNVTEELIKAYPKNKNEITKMFKGYNNASIFAEPKLLLEKIKEKSGISEQLYQVVLNTVNKMENVKTAKEVGKFVALERNRKHNLSKLDWEKYQNLLSILKHSTSFWETNNTNAQSKLSGRDKIAIIDCIGACMGGYGGGWVGALLGGAGSSLIAYIMIYG